MLLFLLSVRLTLVFGIMDLVDLAHGSALHARRLFRRASFAVLTGSFGIAVILAVAASLIAGMVLEVVAIRRLFWSTPDQ